ncbi:TetR/AcrR family transcriptional regulator [Brevibacillus laterosporus]|uniref:TetR/AcrR family transcriptional regulator n=1 Tax=Brevibacillus laterosporus TaxID=1465 RepID=UPI0018CD6A00|nr:TetR/AcrR family transcriptional regulator [Brevibacillus laterosporus]MBG9796719.1 transcriptional regulator [Brevibacillus laterosporus]MCR8936651.1 TetR/AcrR family transcriptional regulator [Brevibacillus laterosporus]MCZ0839290.1 TetR/AcrR family transcriptional regulator [Brevibacillus laterosporus]MCZ0844154.1 TetR/AcrR family transcriptional regulator [Brevibacillus laterosporus]MED1910956.1 TetR/AcrR family transcriptional regulator [Brevibacillus laterosporus]
MKKKPHADSKKKDILHAAMRLFATKGIDGISVKEIGDAAGVTDAAIYKHFKNKNEVASEVFTQYCNSYTKMIDFYVSQSGTFHDRFDCLIDQLVEMHDEDHCGLLLLSQHHDVYQQVAQKNMRQPLDALIDLILQGIESNELPEQDARLSAVLIIGAFTGLAVSSFQGELPSQLEALASQIKNRLFALLQ